MLHTIQSALATEAMERATLLVNHVLASEPAAAQRLGGHVGRCLSLQVNGWPGWLPPLPRLVFRITPAALVEWCGPQANAQPQEQSQAQPQAQSQTQATEPIDLQISVDASNPAKALMQALAGERPRVDVAGDAAFATDVNWLFDNLRWDIEDDLAQLVGPVPAHEMARLGRAVAGGLRDALNTVGAMAARGRRGEQTV
jgi:ubiquinone biosynthesis accessory factor UbiJ